MINFFVFNGRPSTDFGIYLSGTGTFNAPERDVSKVEIPGRNGDLLIDNGRFKNTSLTYPAFIREAFKGFSDAARAWLMENYSYGRLEDTYHPDQYRMARFSGPMEFDMKFLNHSGEFDIIFDCKPQRFLKAGEQIVTTQSEVTLVNPTRFPALPLLRIYGTGGSLYIGNELIQIEEIDGYIDIDCDTQNAYKGIQNCNGKITGSFPSLPAGQTGIKLQGNLTKAEIKPRWWTI